LGEGFVSATIDWMGEAGDKETPNVVPQKEEAHGFGLKLRAPVFSYIADGLAQVYSGELRRVRRDGSFNEIGEFHKSTFGVLMTRVLDKLREEPEPTENVEFNLNQQEVDLIIAKLPEEKGVAGKKIRREMINELRNTFNNARFDTKVMHTASRVLRVVRGKKTES